MLSGVQLFTRLATLSAEVVGLWFLVCRCRVAGYSGWSVRETTVRSRIWITALADGGDLVDLGGHWVEVVQALVDGLAAQPAVVLFGQDSLAELVAAVSVSSARVAHRLSP